MQTYDDDPFHRAMLVLANSGVHSVTISGTTKSGVRIVVKGGAPKPKKVKSKQ